jgi:hypothetical protein
MLMPGGWMNATSDEGLGPVERRYLHWLQRASPADIERAHVPILARLSADQRLALMRAAATAAHLPQRALEEPGMATPARTARCLSQAQARVPGLIPQLLGLLPGPALLRRLALPALAGALAGAFAASVMAGALEDGAAPDAGPLGEADLTGLPDAHSGGVAASGGDLASALTYTGSVDPDVAFADSVDLLSAVGDFFA